MPVSALVLSIGLALGVLADVLFHDAHAGLNLALWVGALATTGWLLRRRVAPADPKLTGLVGLAVCFAACFAWRASPFLLFWNGTAIGSAAVMVAVHLRGNLLSAWVGDYVRGAAGLARTLTLGPLTAAGRLPWPGSMRAAYGPHVRASAVGLVLAAPVVLIFGGLLTSADPVLEAFVVELLHWDFREVFEHAWMIGITGWLAAGTLWIMTSSSDRTEGRSAPGSPVLTLGLTEITIPLGALTVLLVCFLAVQARYLFGGETVMRLTGLTYAEFARSGFFELVVVAALVVPLLLSARWTLDRTSRVTVDNFRALAVVLSGLVALVMVSALARMRLYVAAYGLTEDRLYATAFMAWVGWVLLWLVVTEWRDRPHRFATGAMLAGFAVMAALNVLNPDGLIARTNIARGTTGVQLDAQYLARLSLDAVPSVAAHWQELGVEDRCVLRRGVLSKANPVDDWREWTWSGWRAARAARALLAADACPETGSGPVG